MTYVFNIDYLPITGEIGVNPLSFSHRNPPLKSLTAPYHKTITQLLGLVNALSHNIHLKAKIFRRYLRQHLKGASKLLYIAQDTPLIITNQLARLRRCDRRKPHQFSKQVKEAKHVVMRRQHNVRGDSCLRFFQNNNRLISQVVSKGKCLNKLFQASQRSKPKRATASDSDALRLKKNRRCRSRAWL